MKLILLLSLILVATSAQAASRNSCVGLVNSGWARAVRIQQLKLTLSPDPVSFGAKVDLLAKYMINPLGEDMQLVMSYAGHRFSHVHVYSVTPSEDIARRTKALIDAYNYDIYLALEDHVMAFRDKREVEAVAISIRSFVMSDFENFKKTFKLGDDVTNMAAFKEKTQAIQKVIAEMTEFYVAGRFRAP